MLLLSVMAPMAAYGTEESGAAEPATETEVSNDALPEDAVTNAEVSDDALLEDGAVNEEDNDADAASGGAGVGFDGEDVNSEEDNENLVVTLGEEDGCTLTIPTFVGGTVTAAYGTESTPINSGETLVPGGETVTLAVSPDALYKLSADSLKIIYDEGDGETVKTLTGTTFQMPAAAVTVAADFERDQRWSVTVDDAITNGTLEVSAPVPAAGRALSLTFALKPDSGYSYKRGTLNASYVNGNGDAVKLTLTASTYTASPETLRWTASVPAADFAAPNLADVFVTTEFWDANDAPKMTFTAVPDKTNVDVGDIVTITATITSDTPAYGLSVGFRHEYEALKFDQDSFAEDNPDVTLQYWDAVGGSTNYSEERLHIDSDGHTVIVDENKPLTITLKYKVAARGVNTVTIDGTPHTGIATITAGGTAPIVNNSYPSSQSNLGGSQVYTALLFTDPTLRYADVYVSNYLNFGPSKDAVVNAGRAIATGGTSIYLQTATKATVKLTTEGTAADGTNDSIKDLYYGDTVNAKLIINSEVDAYGFAFVVGGTSYLKVDEAAFKAQYPGFSTVQHDFYLTVYCESNGSTAIVKAGEELVIRLPLKVAASFTTSNLALYTTSKTHILLADPTARLMGAGGITPDIDKPAQSVNDGRWSAIIPGAVADKRAVAAVDLTPNVYPTAPELVVTFKADGGVVFGEAQTGIIGGRAEPVTLTATITAPTGKDVYGFATVAAYPGNYLTLDENATKEANPGLDLNIIEHTGIGTTSASARLYADPNGNQVLIEKGKTYDVKLVFLPYQTIVAGVAATAQVAGTRTVVLGGFTQGKATVLITDPSVRTMSDLRFNMDKNGAAEAAGKAAAFPTDARGTIITTKKLSSLVLSSAGYYTINNLEDLQTFAEAVKAGDNMIWGDIPAAAGLIDLTGVDWEGIGTEQYPYLGTLKGNNISGTPAGRSGVKIDRTVNANNQKVVIGGLINYLGEGGKVSDVTVAGSLSVSNAAAGSSIGGYVGRADGGLVQGLSYNNTAERSISITANNVNGDIGGFVGTAAKASSLASGITYPLYNLTFTGSISVTGNGTTNVGGIAGAYNGLVDDSATTNQSYGVKTDAQFGGSIVGGTNVGGLFGKTNGGVLTYQTGNGIYVDVPTNMARGYAISGGTNVGGVVGAADGTKFDNVFNTGAVSGVNAGGLVGKASGATTITESWNTGAVNGTTAAGGIAGEVSGASLLSNFNLGAVSAAASAGGITGKQTAAPAKYKGNYYVTGSNLGDGITTLSAGHTAAVWVSPENTDKVTLTGTNPGKYSYAGVVNEPAQDTDGVYLLETAADIAWFAKKVNSNVIDGTDNAIHAKLMADIDLSDENHTPIGGNQLYQGYRGTFDGNGKTVTVNLTGTNVSFFGYLRDGAVVKNLTIDGNITGGTNVAGITVSAQGGTITGTEGVARLVTIENCVNRADITATSGAAGIVNAARYAIIKDCTNYGNIKVTSDAATATGGIVGGVSAPDAPSSTTVTGCKNYGDITGGKESGGIVGRVTGGNVTDISAKQPVLVEDCVNYGNISTMALASQLGGIVGNSINRVVLTVNDCANNGDITSPGNYIGGVVGGSVGSSYSGTVTITNSTNSGALTCTYDGTDAARLGAIYIGGIGGYFSMSTTMTQQPEVPTQPGYAAPKDNTNVGTISGPTGGTYSGVLGQAANSTANYDPNEANGNKSVSVGGDKYPGASTGINSGDYMVGADGKVVEKPYVDPGNGGTPPPANNSGGSSAATPPPRTPVRTIAVAPATVNAPVVAAVSPESTAQTAPPEQQNVASQPEIIGDLNVPTTVLEETQSNNVVPIILIIVIVVVVAILLFLGAKKRRGSTES
jgi:hypothetical protein